MLLFVTKFCTLLSACDLETFSAASAFEPTPVNNKAPAKVVVVKILVFHDIVPFQYLININIINKPIKTNCNNIDVYSNNNIFVNLCNNSSIFITLKFYTLN